MAVYRYTAQPGVVLQTKTDPASLGGPGKDFHVFPHGPGSAEKDRSSAPMSGLDGLKLSSATGARLSRNTQPPQFREARFHQPFPFSHVEPVECPGAGEGRNLLLLFQTTHLFALLVHDTMGFDGKVATSRQKLRTCCGEITLRS